MCICQCSSLNSSHPLLLPLCPQVCSVRLHLYSCSDFRQQTFQLDRKDSTKLYPNFAIPWTVACPASLSMGFRKEYWSGLPFPSPGKLPNPGIEPRSPTLQAATSTELHRKTREDSKETKQRGWKRSKWSYEQVQFRTGSSGKGWGISCPVDKGSQ